MGHVHLGPAIKIAKKVEKTFRDLSTCSNLECEYRQSLNMLLGEFCSKCGSPVETIKVPKDRRISFYDFTNENPQYVDALFHPPYDDEGIWLDNRKTPGTYEYDDYASEATVYIDDDFEGRRFQQLDRFTAKHETLLRDIKEFGLEAEVVYVMITYGF